MVNGRNGSIIRKKFRPSVSRFNKNVIRSLPPDLPTGQTGRKMKISEAERRIIQRRRSQSAGIRTIRRRTSSRLGRTA